MCIMKERPLEKIEAGCGAASAALCRGFAAAALGDGAGVVCPAKTAAGSRQMGWRMALYLEGK
jgi:hypothetical protein